MSLSRFFLSLLREPLFHFLLIGLGLFILYSQVNTQDDETNEKIIVISKQKQAALAIAFNKERGRLASPQELEAILQNEIKEEVLYREAMRMGLDKEDGLIRRRLAQKMKYLFEDLSVIQEPSDDTLKAFLQEHSQKFTEPATLSFSQVFIHPNLHPKSLRQEIKKLSNQLQDTPIEQSFNLGDRSLTPYTFQHLRKQDVVKVFGKEFSNALFEVPIQSWQGPIESAYGLNFVYVQEKEPAHLATFEQIKTLLAQEYKRIKQIEANEAFYEKIKQSYVIKVEPNIMSKNRP